MIDGYHFGRDAFALLLLRKFYPERTDSESAIIRDFLQQHIEEFDAIDFSVRVGQGLTPDSSLLPQVAANAVRSSKKRIDMVAWQGNVAVLIEAKTRVSHEVLGQLLTDKHLWIEENPDGPEPRLVAIGRRSDDDSLRAIAAHGIDVYIYEAVDAAANAG